MLLAIDVGNTNTVFAVSDGESIKAEWRLSTNANRTADEYGFWLRHLIQNDLMQNDLMQSDSPDCLPITGAILATVVPQTQFELMQCVRRYFKVEPILVGAANANIPLKIDVDNPHEVGADRLVNALQGWLKYQCGMIIIDFGTATTFDVVDSNGTYIGGVIAPGVNLSLAALQQAAAKLPSIRIRAPEKVIGRNTISAMESGIYYGYVGMIEGLIQRIKAECRGITKVIATGGLASLYAKSTSQIDEIATDLTIDGLINIYKLQQKE
jgi:type III pantothenate kinase